MNFNNITKLIKKDLILNKSFLKKIIICCILFIAITPAFSTSVFDIVLFALGFIVTITLFEELNEVIPNNFMLLPCSIREKYISKYLLSSVLFCLLVIIMATIGTSLNFLLMLGLTKIKQFFSPDFVFNFSRVYISQIDSYYSYVLIGCMQYLLLHSIVIYALNKFRKNSLNKALLLCMAVKFTIFMFVMLSAQLLSVSTTVISSTIYTLDTKFIISLITYIIFMTFSYKAFSTRVLA